MKTIAISLAAACFVASGAMADSVAITIGGPTAPGMTLTFVVGGSVQATTCQMVTSAYEGGSIGPAGCNYALLFEGQGFKDASSTHSNPGCEITCE